MIFQVKKIYARAATAGNRQKRQRTRPDTAKPFQSGHTAMPDGKSTATTTGKSAACGRGDIRPRNREANEVGHRIGPQQRIGCERHKTLIL